MSIRRRIARRVIALVASNGDRESILADLDEEAAAIEIREGAAAANRWWQSQARRSLIPLAHRRFSLAVRHLPVRLRAERLRIMPTTAALLSDIRFSWRLMRRSPAASLAVIAAIATGVAAVTAVATVAENTLLRPLPFETPDRLVRLRTSLAKYGAAPETNFLDARDVRATSESFTSVGLYNAWTSGIRTSEDTTPVEATVLDVTHDVVDALHLRPDAGRLFTDADQVYGAPPVVVLSRAFWLRAFGGDVSAVGRPLWIGAGRATIVGVLPASADHFPTGGADVWEPLTFPANSFINQRGSMSLTAIARLAPSVSLTEARAELRSISSRLALEYPATNTGRVIDLDGLQGAMTGPVRPTLVALAAAAAVILLIVCMNVGNLLLAQSAVREREFLVRRSLGATRGDLMRQLAVETVVIVSAAGALGIAGAPALTVLFVNLYPDHLPLTGPMAIDARVAFAALGVSCLAAIVAGLPRLMRLRRDAAGSVSAGRGTVGTAGARLSRTLLAAQVAFAVVLLSSGALLVRTFIAVASASPGFDANDLLTIRVSLPAQPSAERTAQLQDRLRDITAALPGVSAAAHAMYVPFAPETWGDDYRPIGVDDPNAKRPIAHFYMVSADYFSTMRLPLAFGTSFTASAAANAPKVMVISRQFARTAFGTDAAVGRRLHWNGDDWDVVGVANDVHHASPWNPPDDDVYVPRQQVVRGRTSLLVRTANSPDTIVRRLRDDMRAAGIDGAIVSARRMTDRIADVSAPSRFRAALASALALIGLCLAAMGIYSVAAFAVRARTAENGVRIAFGAAPYMIVRGMMADTWRAVAWGLVPGVAISLAVQKWLGNWLDGLATSPVVLIVAAVIAFSALATIAAWMPARRASRVDPVKALSA